MKRLNMIKPTLLLIVALFSASVLAESTAKIYTYHDKPPYNVVRGSGDGQGIYQHFIEYMNKKQNDVHLKLEYVPRERLEQRLTIGELDGAIIGVSPIWFKDKAQTKFLWSHPFMHDKDVVISRRDIKLNYSEQSDLVGIRMALPRGLYFWGVTELVNQGKIPVFTTDSDRQSFKMMLHHNAKATITSILTYRVLSKEFDDSHLLEIQHKPHDQFSRQLLFPKRERALYSILSPIVERALLDDDWIKKLEEYGYEY